MSKKKTYTEKTSADAILVAFDYQYYFFLWKLLSLDTGESVGLEVKDDVHTELDNHEQILYQVKHTVKTKSDGTPLNLTASDKDLWKTLSNWSKVICDKNDNRENKVKQLLFLKKTSFVLASNKSLANYAEELTEETTQILESLAYYIDYEKMRRDMELGGEVYTIETGCEEIHIFWNH